MNARGNHYCRLSNALTAAARRPSFSLFNSSTAFFSSAGLKTGFRDCVEFGSGVETGLLQPAAAMAKSAAVKLAQTGLTKGRASRRRSVMILIQVTVS